MTERGVVSPTRFAQRGFARLAYETAGTGAGSDGPVVLLLHDLLAPRASLAPWRDALAAAGARVILPDLRGHGASAAIPGVRYSVAELVLDVLAVLDAEGAASVAVLGVGLGGTIGLDLAQVAGERVRRLLLIEPLLPGLARDDADPEVAARFTAARADAAAIADLANRGAVDQALDRYFTARAGAGNNWRTGRTPAQLGAMRRHSAAFGTLLNAVYAYQPALTKLPPTALARDESPAAPSAGGDIDALAVARLRAQPAVRPITVTATLPTAEAVAFLLDPAAARP